MDGIALMTELQPVVFIGATAVPEVAEIVYDINEVEPSYRIEGILDDNPDLEGTEVQGIPVLGPLGLAGEMHDVRFIFCIGSYRTRLERYQIIKRLSLPDDRYVTLVHPTAKIYSSASVGDGCIIHKGSVIADNTRLGRFVVIIYNVVIGAQNCVGDGALITSHVTTNSGVTIGPYSFIGSACAIAENVVIGPGAMVAMRSLVLRDVEPGVFQFGEPPKILKKEEVPEEIMAAWLGECPNPS